MKLGALVALAPAMALGVVLLAPSPAEADHHRSSDRGSRSGDDRSYRGRDRSDDSHRGDRRGRQERYSRGGHSQHGRYARSQYDRYRESYRSYRPRYYRPAPPVVYFPAPRYYAPAPRYYAPPPRYYAPRGRAYAPYRPYRGSLSIGLPFLGFTWHF